MVSHESLLVSDALNNELGVLSSIVKQQHEVQWGGLVGFLKIGMPEIYGATPNATEYQNRIKIHKYS